MSNYYQTTFFTPKDFLPATDPNKTIFGAAYDIEFGNISTAVATKLDSVSIATLPINFAIGTVGVPGISFATKFGTGLSSNATGDLNFSVNGILQASLPVVGGLTMAGATGGAQGIGTINATAIYVNGVLIGGGGGSFAPLNSPAFTGIPTAPTASLGTNTAQLATTAYTMAQIASSVGTFATLNNPSFTGIPTAPTAANSTNTTQIATTAQVLGTVTAALANFPAKIYTGVFTCINGTTAVSFGHTFISNPSVFVQWAYTSPSVGYVASGSVTTTGFSYTNSNSGTCFWLAVGN